MDDACPICLDEFVDPVPAPRCKHVFCTDCLGKWFALGGTCPLCRASLEEYEEHEKPAAVDRAPPPPAEANRPPPPASPWWIRAEWTIVMIMCFIVLREAYSILRGMATEAYYEKKGAPEGRRDSGYSDCIADYQCPQARDECKVIVCSGGTCEARLKGECASDADCKSASGMNYACDLEKCACYDNSIRNYDDTESFSSYTPARVAVLGGAYQTAPPWFVYRTLNGILEITMQLKARVYSPAAVVVNIANTPYNIDTSRYKYFTAFAMGGDIYAVGIVVNATALRIDFGLLHPIHMQRVGICDGDDVVIIGHFIGQYTRA